MQIKAKYKIARRLGYPIFEKTQTQKYALRQGRRKDTSRRPKALSDFGRQLLEKQKMRYTYLLNERQTKRYVSGILEKKGIKQTEKLFETLERRLDNVSYRLGFGPTRLAVRQLVSHGHIAVNGRRVNVPSYPVSIGDKVAIRAGSAGKKIFLGLDDKLKEFSVPSWLKYDAVKKEATVVGLPKLDTKDIAADLETVLEYYKR